MDLTQLFRYRSTSRLFAELKLPEVEDTFAENLKILKKVSFRGLRAFVVLSVGLTSLYYARRKRSREEV